MTSPHLWTKNEVRKLKDLWDTKSLEEVAIELNLKPEQISYMAGQMRKVGFKLSTKRRRGGGRVQILLRELLAERD